MEQKYLARFTAKYEVCPDTGCWLWTAARAGAGYGVMNVDGKMRYAHRLSHEHFAGPIPEGMQIHHECRVKLCCNPSHLRVVTPMENTRLELTDFCKWGHEYTPENTYTVFDKKVGRSHRKCRECSRQTQRRLKARKDAARAAARSASKISS